MAYTGETLAGEVSTEKWRKRSPWGNKRESSEELRKAREMGFFSEGGNDA